MGCGWASDLARGVGNFSRRVHQTHQFAAAVACRLGVPFMHTVVQRCQPGEILGRRLERANGSACSACSGSFKALQRVPKAVGVQHAVAPLPTDARLDLNAMKPARHTHPGVHGAHRAILTLLALFKLARKGAGGRLCRCLLPHSILSCCPTHHVSEEEAAAAAAAGAATLSTRRRAGQPGHSRASCQVPFLPLCMGSACRPRTLTASAGMHHLRGGSLHAGALAGDRSLHAAAGITPHSSISAGLSVQLPATTLLGSSASTAAAAAMLLCPPHGACCWRTAAAGYAKQELQAAACVAMDALANSAVQRPPAAMLCLPARPAQPECKQGRHKCVQLIAQ
jgi:hypothetical protein